MFNAAVWDAVEACGLFTLVLVTKRMPAIATQSQSLDFPFFLTRK